MNARDRALSVAGPTPPPTAGNVDADIRVSDLVVTYDGTTPAIDGLSLQVGRGEFVAVLGPSGCGKSTLLHVLSGLLPPARGTAELLGRPVSPGSPESAIGYVFQDHRLLPWRTVGQNLEIVLDSAGVPRDQWQPRIERYLAMLQIERFQHAWPMRLSGGQRQRVSIARALALEPTVILMDEPFSTLDEVTARQLRGQLVRLWRQSGVTILFVTHSIREAVYLADRVAILSRGPARLLELLPVTLPRPRRYEDPELTELEAAVVQRVLDEWGYQEDADSGQGE